MTSSQSQIVPLDTGSSTKFLQHHFQLRALEPEVSVLIAYKVDTNLLRQHQLQSRQTRYSHQ